MPDNSKPKWTEIEHLPKWDEEFYHVYTAKKHGKWVMLKTLRPELADDPACREMIGKEFDVRYNLAHPHIVMINDFEEVPGLGQCIITDDVYGDSLRTLIDEGKVTPEIQEKVVNQLLDAIEYIQKNHIVHHPIRPETIIFTENIRNLKVIDVGFDQRSHLSPADISEDLAAYGRVLQEVLRATGDRSKRLNAIANRCANPKGRPFRDVTDVKMALAGHSNKRVYIVITIFLVIMAFVLGWLSVRPMPGAHPATPPAASATR
ncbi:MAG: protein kinase [[Clostridium] fimetarium]|nr:protein kinase [[Clostridium] fimetarium]